MTETNLCDSNNQYCPYVNFPTELYQKAFQRNALMEATDEAHVLSLTKEEFAALRNRVQAFIFPDKKQDVDLIAQINRITQKMDDIYNKATQKQSPSMMFKPKHSENEKGAACSYKM